MVLYLLFLISITSFNPSSVPILFRANDIAFPLSQTTLLRKITSSGGGTQRSLALNYRYQQNNNTGSIRLANSEANAATMHIAYLPKCIPPLIPSSIPVHNRSKLSFNLLFKPLNDNGRRCLVYEKYFSQFSESFLYKVYPHVQYNTLLHLLRNLSIAFKN